MRRTRSAVTMPVGSVRRNAKNTNVETRPVRAEFFSAHRWTRTYELHRGATQCTPTNPREFTANGNLFASISVVTVLDPSADPFVILGEVHEQEVFPWRVLWHNGCIRMGTWVARIPAET
jgi:hypothetical protein